jgi:hypothetical protein
LNVFEPDGLWDAVRNRLPRPGSLGWLALIPVVGAFAVAIAAETGVRVFNTEWHAVFGYSARPDADGSRFRALWVALAVTPYLQGVVGAFLLPMVGRTRQWRAAIAVAVVGTVPLYLAGLTMVWLPGIILVLGAFFVSFVWWVNGAPELLDVPHSEATEFVTVTLIGSSASVLLLTTALPS